MIRTKKKCEVAFIAMLIAGVIGSPGLPVFGHGQSASRPRQSQAPRTAGAEKAAQEEAQDDARVVPVMWEEPLDLESRDLFYGIGGKKGAPDPSDKFTYLEKITHGHAEKILVEDSKGRRWKVKFGEEPRPETVASRIVWAVGYHADEDYFVDEAYVEGRGVVRNVRFERDDDGYKKVGRWDWTSNPFVGTRDLDGLKVLMALLNNFDLKTLNNKIVKPGKKKKREDYEKQIYYVNDLGATLGSTGKWFGGIPIFGEAPAGTKGSPRDYSKEKFINGVHNGIVTFSMKRTRAQRGITGVRMENARWMGNLLARLSDKQLCDAFRAAQFPDNTIQLYVGILHKRISQLQELR